MDPTSRSNRIPAQRSVDSEPGLVEVDHGATATELFEVLYRELKARASRQIRRHRHASTLYTTELVHELYLRFTRQGAALPCDREHFLALSARAMRQILVDHARGRAARKRSPQAGKSRLQEDLTRTEIDVETEAVFLLSLDRALRSLEQVDRRLASTTELRFFGGFTVAETADILNVSEPTVKRDSRLARAFVARTLACEPGSDSRPAPRPHGEP